MKLQKKNYIFIFSLIFVVCLLIAMGSFASRSRATGVTGMFFGWAWSENIGWISLNNCISATNCPGNPYGVIYTQIGNSDIYNVTGYAWSENIGWIKFGGLSAPFPSGTGTDPHNARMTVSGSIAELSGWARACAGTDPGTNGCSNTSQTDGWDGWISLKGSGYGVSFGSTTGFPEGTALDLSNRFAWGSNVVGWIDFSNVTIEPPVSTITVFSSLSGDSCVSIFSPNVNLQWQTTGMTSCNISKNGSWAYTIPAANLSSGDRDFSVSSPQSVFILNCYDSNNVFYATAPLTVEVLNSCVPTPQNKRPKYIER